VHKDNLKPKENTKPTISIISVCDTNYASRFLVMAESLRQYNSRAPIYVLALDSACQRTLELVNLPNLYIVSLNQLNIELEGVVEFLEGSRGRKEFIFSLTPFLLKFLSKCVDSDYVFYVDADIYFHGAPDHILKDRTAVAGIFSHQFRSASKHLEVYGIYNVGVVYFRRDPKGWQVLDWWAEKCLESTNLNLEIEPKVFGDQKYLDFFPENFRGVETHPDYIYCKGPWNTNDMSPFRNSKNFFFFHFSGLEIGKRMAVLGFRAYSWRPTGSTRKFYKAYVRKVRRWDKKLCIHSNAVGVKAFKEWLKILKFCDFIFYRF
jgi:hypothetical protein